VDAGPHVGEATLATVPQLPRSIGWPPCSRSGRRVRRASGRGRCRGERQPPLLMVQQSPCRLRARSRSVARRSRRSSTGGRGGCSSQRHDQDRAGRFLDAELLRRCRCCRRGGRGGLSLCRATTTPGLALRLADRGYATVSAVAFDRRVLEPPPDAPVLRLQPATCSTTPSRGVRSSVGPQRPRLSSARWSSGSPRARAVLRAAADAVAPPPLRGFPDRLKELELGELEEPSATTCTPCASSTAAFATLIAGLRRPASRADGRGRVGRPRCRSRVDAPACRPGRPRHDAPAGT